MPTAITPVAQWVPPLTNAGADIPNSANMLAVLQTHADRQEFAYLQNALRLQLLPATGPALILGVGLHERAGQLVLVGSTTYARVGIGYPKAINGTGTGQGFVYQQAETLAGSPTLSGLVNSACNGSSDLVLVSGGYSYLFTPQAGAGARYAFDGITTARDVLWSPYRGRFIAVGGSPAGRIESSTGGVTWTNEQSALDPSNGWHRIAGDATGRYLLVASAANNWWAYSSDGGDTWTAFQKTIGTDDVYTVTGLAYDDSRGLWLATFDGGSFAGDARVVWSVANPVSGTWAAVGTAVPIYGLGTADYMTYARSIVCCGSTWIVGSEGSVSGKCNVWLSRDAGATWEMPIGYGAGGGINLRRVGSYLAFGNGSYFEAISCRLWT